jgi:class I fructose-bisphosphate aldolase
LVISAKLLKTTRDPAPFSEVAMNLPQLQDLLGPDAQPLLSHQCKTVDKAQLHLPGPDFVDRIWAASDRSPRVLRSLQTLFNYGRLAGSGYLSILPVDQGIEHSGGASFAKNPMYFDGENIVKLAIEGGCNAVASTFGVLSSVARKYAHKIPFIVKINHNEFLSYPNEFDQIKFGTVKEAYDLGAVAVGATIYFGSDHSRRQIVEVAEAFQEAHELGMATILWCYLRNNAFKKDKDYHVSADLTGQANHLGVTINADIIKQKMPLNNGGYKALSSKENPYGKIDDLVYTHLTSDHPIDLCRYQVMNCYMGRRGLINSGGESKGQKDLAEAIHTAVINKRAGGMGLISGRKAFQKPFKEGAALLQAIQDVYLCKDVTIA